MSTKFIHCPNCKKKPSGGIFGGEYFSVYECKKCGFHFCHNCGGDRCPNCASKEKQEVGKAWQQQQNKTGLILDLVRLISASSPMATISSEPDGISGDRVNYMEQETSKRTYSFATPPHASCLVPLDANQQHLGVQSEIITTRRQPSNLSAMTLVLLKQPLGVIAELERFYCG